MMPILNNIRRIFVDDGRRDRSFVDQEMRLHAARAELLKEADALKRAAEVLADIIRCRTTRADQ